MVTPVQLNTAAQREHAEQITELEKHFDAELKKAWHIGATSARITYSGDTNRDVLNYVINKYKANGWDVLPVTFGHQKEAVEFRAKATPEPPFLPHAHIPGARGILLPGYGLSQQEAAWEIDVRREAKLPRGW